MFYDTVSVSSLELRLCKKKSIITALHAYASCTWWGLIDLKVEHVTLCSKAILCLLIHWNRYYHFPDSVTLRFSEQAKILFTLRFLNIYRLDLQNQWNLDIKQEANNTLTNRIQRAFDEYFLQILQIRGQFTSA